MARSIFCDFLKKGYDAVVLKKNDKKIIKRHNVTDDDIKNADTAAYDVYSGPEEFRSLYLLFFDFDTHGKKSLISVDAVENANKLHQLLGSPTPYVIQYSKSGTGVHLLIKAWHKTPLFTKHGKLWDKDVKYVKFVMALHDYFKIDKSSILNPHGLCDVATRTPNKRAFEVIKSDLNVVGDGFELTDAVMDKVINYCSECKSATDLSNEVLAFVEWFKNSAPGDRNNNLYIAVCNIWQYRLVGGFNEQAIEGLLHDAAIENGMITDDGEHGFLATLESGKKSANTLDAKDIKKKKKNLMK
jgi:hypothetical protein